MSCSSPLSLEISRFGESKDKSRFMIIVPVLCVSRKILFVTISRGQCKRRIRVNSSFSRNQIATPGKFNLFPSIKLHFFDSNPPPTILFVAFVTIIFHATHFPFARDKEGQQKVPSISSQINLNESLARSCPNAYSVSSTSGP